jgi:raffinose/stachyose/melibiose transport system permease protein
MIRQSITIGTFLTLVNAFKQFDLNLMLGNGGPAQFGASGSIQATQLLSLDIVKHGQLGTIDNMRAFAQAEAIIFFLILFAISMLQMYMTKSKEVEM